MKFKEFKITESAQAARIPHAEDLIFHEGSSGARKALEALKDIGKGGFKQVTIKWDGSPAIVFGRNEDGEFVFTDKSGFSKGGGAERATSGEELEQHLLNRSGGKNREDPKRIEFAGKMKMIFDIYKNALSKNHRGFFKGDLLYYTTPENKGGNYNFKPNVVEYAVDAGSKLGKKIGASKTGVVIHKAIDLEGNETPVDSSIDKIFKGNDVLVVPPVSAEKAPSVPLDILEKVKKVIDKDANAIDSLLDSNKLAQGKMKNLPDLLYAYTNSKVDSGLDQLGGDFLKWLESNPKISDRKKANVLDYISKNQQGFSALWEVVNSLMNAKDKIISSLDSQSQSVKQSINGESGGEGYVFSHPKGDIKLVPRASFSKANRSVQRESKMKINQIIESAELSTMEKVMGMMAQKIRNSLDINSGVQWDDDEFNKAAEFSTLLAGAGATFGPSKDFNDAVKKSGLTPKEAVDIMLKAGLSKEFLSKFLKAVR